jgi:hypothetical protein
MISSEFDVLTLPLQEYISTKRLRPSWHLSQNRDTLHHNIKRNGKDYHVKYTPTKAPLVQQTHSGRRFQSNVTKVSYLESPIFASIAHSQSEQVLLHLSAAAATPPVVFLSFEHNLRSYGNESLWRSLDYDKDGSWILRGMINRSLIIIHDGSYMKDIFPLISSVATMIYCTVAKKQCKCPWAKKSESVGSY